VLDGTDDFDTRYLVNRACVAAGKPLISGALTQWEGQLGLYDPARGGPCYACVFPVRPAPGSGAKLRRGGGGRAAAGIIGAMMATEAVKHLTDAGEGLRGRLMITMRFTPNAGDRLTEGQSDHRHDRDHDPRGPDGKVVDFSDAYMRSEMVMMVRGDEDRFTDAASFAADPDLLMAAQPGTTPFYVGRL
jgi:hypothetical protein